MRSLSTVTINGIEVVIDHGIFRGDPDHEKYYWYLSRAQAKREIFEFIEIDYNRKRRHSTIGSMSPKNFENQRKCA